MDSAAIAILLIALVIGGIVIAMAMGMNQSQSSSYSSSNVPGDRQWANLSPEEQTSITNKLAGILMNAQSQSPPPSPQPQVIVVNTPQPSVIEVDRCPRHSCPFDRCGCHVRDRCPMQATGCINCVPIPSGALKATNEDYWRDRYYQTPGVIGGSAYPFVSCNCGCGSPRPCKNFRKLPGMRGPASDNYFTPYGENSDFHNVPFISSVSSYSPYPAVESCWEKIGILTSSLSDANPNSEKNLLNLYRRPIAPIQHLWEYQVQDAAGFVIKLKDREIRNGDSITVPGKQGTWTAKLFTKDKWIWSC